MTPSSFMNKVLRHGKSWYKKKQKYTHDQEPCTVPNTNDTCNYDTGRVVGQAIEIKNKG